jgi:hypothetical protein
MVTPDDIARIEILAELDSELREQLALAAADLTLLPGEYAVQEGGEQALFGLLAGRIEAVKQADGVEKVVGERHPGAIFGEVPITLGAVFPVGFRAAEESRVLRFGPSRSRQACRCARGSPDERPPRTTGTRRQPTAAARDCRGGTVRPRLRGAPSLPRSQPDHVRVGSTRRARDEGALGRAIACPGRLADPTGR